MVLFFDILLVKLNYKITKFTDFETEINISKILTVYLINEKKRISKNQKL